MPQLNRPTAGHPAQPMPHRRPSRHALALATAACLGGLAAAPAQAAVCTWNTSSGNWAAIVNWTACVAGNGNPVGAPGAADTANIGAAGLVTINTGQSVLNLNNAGRINIDAFGLNLVGGGGTTNTGFINVGGASTANLGVSAGHNINNTGGVINIAAGSVVNQFGSTLTGGTVNTTGTGALVAFSSASNFLNNVTLNGRMDMASNVNSRQRINNGLTLGGGAIVDINNNGILSFEATSTLAGTGAIVFGNSGAGNRIALDGNGTTTFAAGTTVRGHSGNIGAALNIGGTQTLVNNGTISADVSGGTITLNTSPVVNNGTLSALNGGRLVLASSVTGGGSGQIVAGAGSQVLQSGVAIGGTINTSGSGLFTASSNAANFLSGATLNGNLDMASVVNSRERVTAGGLVLNGTVNINQNGILSFEGNGGLSGNGTVVFGATGPGNRIALDGNGTTTFSAGTLVRGENGSIGAALNIGGTQTLVNDGTISADVAGGTITINTSPVVNNGILRALNGGQLVLASNVSAGATGQIVVGTGSQVLQSGVTISGTINTGGNGLFTATSNAVNFLNAATFNGNLDMASVINSRERVTAGGLVLNGTVNINQNGILSFEGDGGLSGNATIVLGATGAGNRIALDGNGTTTFAAGTTVRGENGSIGAVLNIGGSQTLVNNGTISADVAGGTITINTSPVTNNGTLSALNGGTLVLASNVTGGVGGQILSGAGSQVLQSGVTIDGTINTSGGGLFTATSSASNFLSGATLNGNLDMASVVNSRERVTVGGLVLNGTVNINQNGILSFEGTGGFSGNGTIVLGNTGAGNRIALDGNGITTFAAGTTVRGHSGNIGAVQNIGGAQTLVNNGTISADVAGGTITINSAPVTNNGTLSALNGGKLVLASNVTGGVGGQIVAGAGSQVLQSGVAIGGTINTSGSGLFTAISSASNFLSGATLNGNLDMASLVNSRERVTAGGLVLNGTVNINQNGILSFEGTGGLSGNGTIVFGNTGAGNRIALDGNGTTTFAAGTTVRGHSGNIGAVQNIGGTQTLVNNGTINAELAGGTIGFSSAALVNNGLARAQAGTMNVGVALSGTGTLQVDATGAMNLANGAKAQGTLAMGAAGAALNLGTGNLTLSTDYTNAAWGSGNSFARRAGITGAGLIVAGGNVVQQITGAGVSNGNTANATLTLGNARVGSTTFNYRVANGGTTGPTLRGAIQTTVNGGNLSDARLSGAGVTASNYNAGAPGLNSGNLGVTFTVASAGVIAPLTGQVLNLRSNFENIADQKLNIVIGAGAAAYNAAGGNATPSPVQLAAQRVGGTLSSALTVANTAVAGPFSEDLNVSFSGFTGDASGSGSIAGRLAGTSNTGLGSMSVGVNTASSGAKTGTATLAYETAGAVAGVSNGLGVASAGTQAITVNGNVYAQAVAQLNTPAVNFGIVRVGDSVTARGVTVANTAVGTLTDTLRASLAGGAVPFSTGGTATSINAGGSNGTSLTVGLSTSTAGVFNSSATVTFTSQNPEMADLALGTANLSLAAQVNNLAASTLAKTGGPGSFAGGPLNYTLSFGSVVVGEPGGSATLLLTQSATGPADALTGTFDLSALQLGDPFGLTGFNNFAGLAAGNSLASLTVSFGGNVEGSFDRVVVLNRLSTNGSGPDLNLAPVELRLMGTVTAVPEPGTWALWLAGLAALGGLARRRALASTA